MRIFRWQFEVWGLGYFVGSFKRGGEDPPPGLVPSGRVRMFAVVWEVSLVSRAAHPLVATVSRTPPPMNLHSGGLFGLRTANMASKITLTTAETTPKRLKMAQDGSRGSQDNLKTAQEDPKTAQEGSKRPSKRARKGKNK